MVQGDPEDCVVEMIHCGRQTGLQAACGVPAADQGELQTGYWLEEVQGGLRAPQRVHCSHLIGVGKGAEATVPPLLSEPEVESADV